MSTYITALIAGEYHEVQRHLRGQAGDIPLGHYCRQSLVEHLDADELFTVTKQGFEFFEEPFDCPTRSASTTSSTCRSTTWARWRTPAA